MNAKLKVAICGTGMISASHRRGSLLAGAEIVGVLSATDQLAREAATAWGVPNWYTSLDELLAADVDAVHICVPNQFHYPFAKAALAAGKHVICEKPLGLSVAEAEEMAAAAEASGKVAAIPFVYRYHPIVRELRHRIEEGELGRLLLVQGSYLQDWMLSPEVASWRTDPKVGGKSRAFADIGSHWVDLVEFVSGLRFAELSANTHIAYPERPTGSADAFSGGGGGELAPVETEDTATALLRTSDGVPGNVVVSQVAAGRKNRLWFEISGTEAAVAFDQERPEEAWLGQVAASKTLLRDPGSATSMETKRLSRLPAGHAQGYGDAFDAFIADCYALMRGEERTGVPTFADGLRAARVVEALLSSAETGNWTAIKEGGN